MKALLANYLSDRVEHPRLQTNTSTAHNGQWPMDKRTLKQWSTIPIVQFCCFSAKLQSQLELFSLDYYSFVYSVWCIAVTPNHKNTPQQVLTNFNLSGKPLFIYSTFTFTVSE